MVVPIRDIGRRLPQAGRIRLGEKGPSRPKAINHFRFTAPVPDPLSKLADLYGGTVNPWSDPMSTDRFELYSEADEIAVVLPPDPLDMNYEFWTKAGRKRLCDGITAVIPVPGPEGPEPTQAPCKCAQQGLRPGKDKDACSVKLRLNVVLPEVRGLGLWRLDSGSQYAAREMPGVVETLSTLDGGRGMMRGLLRIERRTKTVETTKGYQTRRFIVPVLDFANSFNEIISGQAHAQIGRGEDPTSPRPGLGGGPAELPSPSVEAAPTDDDEIVDAEIVEEIEEWAETLDTRTRNHILAEARKLADALGEPIPTTFAAIRGETLATIKRGLS